MSNQIQKPMLAGKAEDISTIHYTILCTPKLDGIRCMMVNGQAVTRSFKPIPNDYIRNKLSTHIPDGFDGEILLKNNLFNFQAISSAVMSVMGEPDFVFYIFDKYSELGYKQRMNELDSESWIDSLLFAKRLLPITINNENELLDFERKCLSEGFEGVMIRSPSGPYKFGRSTEKEGYLLKLKRFEDSEAIIISIEEQMENTNELRRDVFGRAERSSFKSGKVPKGTMGSLVVKDIYTDLIFNVGTGFDDGLRQKIWINKEQYIGKIVKYKFQSVGVKEAPRFPVYISMRHSNDM